MTHHSWSLFDVVGVEVEYAIVDAADLRVRPLSDCLLESAAGRRVSEVQLGEIAWSNELVLHVVEFKTREPTEDLTGLGDLLTDHVWQANRWLARWGARLCPTGMHPLMDPAIETHLWPHDDADIYQTFDRIFDCRGHGWSNLQSVHINLPFADDVEFGRLHAAIRTLLPVLPMLAASSPVVEGQLTGSCDNRLEYYRRNCRRIPVVTGEVIPEPVFTQADYRRSILEPIRRAVAPFDLSGILDPIWVNARGAIARPDRGSIEIRVLDTQECASADIAIVALACAVLRGLAEERWSSTGSQRNLSTELLAGILADGTRQGSRATVDHLGFLEVLGLSPGPRSGARLWADLTERMFKEGLLSPVATWQLPLQVLTEQGCLAVRIETALRGTSGTRSDIVSLYGELGECLAHNQMYGTQ